MSSIRILSLPREIRTESEIMCFMWDILGINVLKAKVVPMQTKDGMTFHTAFLEVDPTENPEMLNKIFEEEGHTIQSCCMGTFPDGIRFDNGKLMTHIKIVGHTVKPRSLQLDSGAWTSLYIPFVPKVLAENIVEIIEQKLKLGKTSSVLFSGQSDYDLTLRGVRVFFSEWYDNRTVNQIRRVISEKGEFNCGGFHSESGFTKFRDGAYMVFRENKHTDPRSPMPYPMWGGKSYKVGEDYEQLYDEAVQTNARMTMSMIARESKIKTLEAEIARLTTVQVPGTEFRLDVGEIMAENHRLKEKLERPLTAEESFEKLRGTIKETRSKWDALLAEHGSNTAVQKSGLLEDPYFADLKFDVMEAVKELLDDVLPVAFR
jgi:hypothetical protein